MVAFIPIVRFIVYFCITFTVQNNVIDRSEMPKYFTKYLFFPLNMCVYIYGFMVFITEGFFEVAIESWPEWDFNPRSLNSVQTL